MKRKLSFFGITAIVLAMTAFMIACNSKPKTEASNLVLSADTTGLADFQAWKAVNERTDPSMYNMSGIQTAPVSTAARRTTTARRAATTRTATQPVAQPAKKKGWSKAAKGAAIGGVTGAVAGAVINKKNRVVGGVLGGIIGGGVGYGIGRGMDKKDGRY